jgi:uncharacterized protein YndB with AHSA1/START domain
VAPQNDELVARATITITAHPHDVWSALVDPAAIRQYMFGTTVESEWRPGSPIVWRGEWQGRAYEDKGRILTVRPERSLQYTHFSPLSGLPDEPGNYHTVTIDLSPEGTGTRVTLTQDGSSTAEARDRSQENWSVMLRALRQYVETRGEAAA